MHFRLHLTYEMAFFGEFSEGICYSRAISHESPIVIDCYQKGLEFFLIGRGFTDFDCFVFVKIHYQLACTKYKAKIANLLNSKCAFRRLCIQFVLI